jgi:hypothetical protein
VHVEEGTAIVKSCRICKLSWLLVGAVAAGLLVHEIPGGIRELKAIRMANWRKTA